jgi:hypothetical protein
MQRIILLIFFFVTIQAKDNVYFFINYMGIIDPTKIDEYRETLFSYANHPTEIVTFNKQEKLFNYFGFKEAFLKEIFPEFNVIVTNTFANLKNVKYIITQEIPRKEDELTLMLEYSKKKLLLFTIETQISNPKSHDLDYLDLYHKVFTWNQDYVNNKKFFWLPAWILWTDVIPMIKDITPFEKKKLCCVVSNNNHFSHPLANHKERLSFITLCEKEALGEFAIYGMKWPDEFKNYQGKISFNGDRRHNKIQTIKNYKFYLCYENTKNINGYVTEKIFECFAAGCVPIYSGAMDISDYIPSNCFIAREAFKSDKELLNYIKTMDKTTYARYLENIKEFLAGSQSAKLSRRYHAKKIRKALHLD